MGGAVTVQDLLDKEAVRQVIATYARGVDRGDPELVRSCFWDDAVDHHGFATLGPEDLAAASKSMSAVFESTMHFLGNSLVEIEGDRAHSETYCIAYHRLSPHRLSPDHLRPREVAAFDRLVGFRIIDQLERRDLVWKFAERVYLFEWSRVDEAQDGWRSALAGLSPALDAVVAHWPTPAGALTGRRDRTDLAYARPGDRLGGGNGRTA